MGFQHNIQRSLRYQVSSIFVMCRTPCNVWWKLLYFECIKSMKIGNQRRWVYDWKEEENEEKAIPRCSLIFQ